ncbi:DUF4185 domain-containing protein [Agriterribacter sp.]|uniref:DUF4185 domain-containing protein n=1 Tax=Agriterribacter sp. TaxID=2821509 RepID=UPI002CC1C65A|nr:DUF4185 domain-containing protein [Agriterribacter sp.]HTN05746.1 DUF4185 domain-containing protein [Agriterribacter sp.]
MPRFPIISLSIFFAGVLHCGCFTQTKQDKNLPGKFKFTAVPAPEWTALFKRNHGWFGGDGIFSIILSGNEKEGTADNDSVLIWFSDTLLGDINDSLETGYTMINNSAALLTGGNPDSTAIHFYWNTAIESHASSLFVPETPLTQKGEYYWLGDGFVNTERNNDIYIFGYRIKNIPGQAVFGFKQTGNTLIRIPAGEKPPFKHITQMEIPFFQGENADSIGSFGAGLLVNTKKAGVPNASGYLYIYGVRGKNKEVIVARVRPEFIEQFNAWRFWDGKTWTTDIKAIQSIADRASNEMSVTPLRDGRYLMVFQKDAIGTYVGVRIGTSPVGPFGPITDVYDVKDDLKDSPNLFPYNAKAHPALSKPGELLISYNINSFDFSGDIKKLPHLYRPRFIKLKYE